MNPRLCALSLALCLSASCGDPCDGREVVLESGASAAYNEHSAPEQILGGMLRDNGPRFAVLDWWYPFGLETPNGTVPVGIGPVARDEGRVRAFAGRKVELRGKFSVVMPKAFLLAGVRCPPERVAASAVAFGTR